MANNPYVNKVVFGDETLIDLTSDTVTADMLSAGYTAHDNSGAPIVGTAIMGDGGISEEELRDTTGWTGKNSLKISENVVSNIDSDIVHTIHKDGDGELIDVTLNGTSNPPSGQTSSYFELAWQNDPSNIYDLIGKEVILTGGISSDIYVSMWIEDYGTYKDIGEGVTFTIPTDITTKSWNISVRVSKNVVCDNVVIQPMLRKSFITDGTFEPHHENVKDWYWGNNAKTGVHNWFNFDNVLSGEDFLVGTYDNFSIQALNDSWAGAVFVTDVLPNTNYNVTSNVTFMNGEGLIDISPYPSGDRIASSGEITSNRNIDISFNSGNNSKLKITCFCTGDVSQTGNVAYANFLLKLVADTSKRITPYAMTNVELTEKQLKLGTASLKDVATSGNASETEVVMGNDTRLTDSRPASDVSEWAKAPTKPIYTTKEIGAASIEELRNTVGWIASKNLGNFIDNKFINNQGEVVDQNGCAATVNPIIIEEGKQYKLYCYDALCGYSVWNGDTMILKEQSLPSETIVDITGGDRFYAEIVNLSGNATVADNKPMVLYADETDTSYEPYHKTVKEELDEKPIIDDNRTTTITTFSSNRIMEIVNTVVGNINSVLDTINGEVI